ncbi:MAG: glycosyltransferase [Candidatus Abyssobacteria bacterium SURF_5]|uniref:Glycosyltransferase n=1 Tax=Abyssobacteria bacterium (strain SURF_5) TaxID=2093360 RepID=A0A3A4NLD3_ABYX5|nr:MAG: glycosyltransferase [Candidatus Abyssubacteria bacterium SURF_5]
MALIVAATVVINYLVGIYYGLTNLIYTSLLTIALIIILRHIKRIKYSSFREFSLSPQTPPISILIPANNEEKNITASVSSALGINYPFFEVIVIDDGSTDSTLQNLINAFDLKKIDLIYRDVIKTAPVKTFYYNPQLPNLLIISKEKGGKADALNCGINICHSPYFCSVDADSVLERDALLRLIMPILESGKRIIACGGVVRALNGSEVINGAVEKVNLPRTILALLQIVEYLRAFLFGRVGLDALNATLILSGTFSLFDKQAVIEVNGFSTDTVTEDMELIVRLHRKQVEKERPYQIKFISDPVCWTEVPEKLSLLGRQRRRWHLGLIQSVLKHKIMLLNPKYGALGLFVMPYYFFVEMLSPIVEVFGYIIVIGCYFLHVISLEFFLLFLTLAIFYGTFLSTASIFLEELTYRRYPLWRHLFTLLLFGILENFGYRQVNSVWRMQAFFNYIIGRREWEYVRGGSRS